MLHRFTKSLLGGIEPPLKTPLIKERLLREKLKSQRANNYVYYFIFMPLWPLRANVVISIGSVQ